MLLQLLDCLPVFFFIFIGLFKELTISAPIHGQTSRDGPIEELGLFLPYNTEIAFQKTIEIQDEGIDFFTAKFLAKGS